MDSAFNAVFSPNTLVCVCVYLFKYFFIKSHLAILLQCSDSPSLFSLTPKTGQFEPFNRINIQDWNCYNSSLHLISLWWYFCLYILLPWRLLQLFLWGKHHHCLILSLCLSVMVYFWWLPGFTDQPGELRGFPVHTHLTKGSRGFGFNIVGGSRPREFLQVYSVTASGPSALKTGKHTINQERLLHEKAILIVKMMCDMISTRERRGHILGHKYLLVYISNSTRHICRLRAVTIVAELLQQENILVSGVFYHLSSSLSPLFGIIPLELSDLPQQVYITISP